MLRFLRRAGIAAVAAAAISAGTAIPAFADAPSTQIQVCNQLNNSITYYIAGANQYDDWQTSYQVTVGAGKCYSYSDWWWEVNRSVESHNYDPNYGKWQWNAVYLPKSSAGGWYRINVHYVTS